MPVTQHDTAQHTAWQQSARDHLWMHFTRHSTYQQVDVPVIVRGEGAYLYDSRGRRYLDALAGLFVSQLGHGRAELAEAASAQMRELAFMPLWSYAHPPAIELAERVADLAPGDLNRVFFTSGGGEAVESAWKLAKNYFKLVGKPLKHKVISRTIAYHGTTHGALSITGLPPLKEMFEPLVPSSFRAPNTNIYRAPAHRDDPEAFGRWAADQIGVAIENEGPDTVAAVFLEPVQNSGGCFPPPPGYFQRVREICDAHDVLLVSDEVICAFGRLGHWFGAERYGYQPDIITCAKGITSGYAPLGAMIASDRLMEPFLHGANTFLHGYTFGGHPVSTAVALRNLEIFETERVNEHVREHAERRGRKAYAAIGKAVGLSEAAVRQRVQRLTEAGVMQIVAVTDPLQLGFARQAMVGIRVKGPLDPVADALAEMDEVDYVVITAGAFDLMVEVVCESDERLLAVISDKIRSLDHVVSTETFMYLRLRKQSYSWGVR